MFNPCLTAVLIRAVERVGNAQNIIYELFPGNEDDIQIQKMQSRQAPDASDAVLIKLWNEQVEKMKKYSMYNCFDTIYASAPPIFSPFPCTKTVITGPGMDEPYPPSIRHSIHHQNAKTPPSKAKTPPQKPKESRKRKRDAASIDEDPPSSNKPSSKPKRKKRKIQCMFHLCYIYV